MIIEKYESYLVTEKGMSENTCQAYLRDLQHFDSFIKSKGVSCLEETKSTEIIAYIMELKEKGRSKSTINRKLASIRFFYHYLIREGKIQENPTEDIKAPKIEKKEIQFLTVEEVLSLLELPDESIKGIRDRAILEVLYATGIRASELIEMKKDDVNHRMGFVKCIGEYGKARIIPLGKPSREALERYILDARETLCRGNAEEALFLNYAGRPFTRQGLWKILREYGEMLELKYQLTPQLIRNSFAVHMLQNGADVKSLQELMGHEDISATQAYLAVTKNRIKDVYDKTHPRA